MIINFIKKIIRRIKIYFFIKKNLKVGSNTRILTSIFNFGTEPYLIEIGSNCTITSGVKFITHDASIGIALRQLNKERVVGDKKLELMSKIKVHDNCMIGVGSIILRGVSIGPNSIVGAGSVVTKDVPEGTIVAGNPARIICTIEEYAEKIESEMVPIINTKNFNLRKKDILNNIQ